MAWMALVCVEELDTRSRGSPGGRGAGRDRDIVQTGKKLEGKDELPRFGLLSMRRACLRREIEFVRNFVPELTFPLIKTYFSGCTFERSTADHGGPR